MKSKIVHRLLQALITLLGAALGALLAQLVLSTIRLTGGAQNLTAGSLALIYLGAAAIGGVILFFCSEPVLRCFVYAFNRIDERFDSMSASQIVGSVSGLIAGLIVAALLSVVVSLIGSGLVSTIISAILYLMLGFLGWALGWKRGAAVLSFLRHGHEGKTHRLHHSKKKAAEPLSCYVDLSVLTDGRIASIARVGFLRGRVVVADCVQDEIRRLSASEDRACQTRAQRAMETVSALQKINRLSVTTAESDPSASDTSAALLNAIRAANGLLLTCDATLSRAAENEGIQVMNVNDLAAVMKPTVQTGDRLTVSIMKEGKEHHQGVGYLEDGSMLVVENGREMIGKSVTVEVTTVLQTSAGRMVFAKPVV